MNEILKKRIEEAAINGSKHYDPDVSKYSQGKQVGYLRGFAEGAEYTLQNQWISVDDALPKNGENVFAIDSDNAYVAWFDETDKDWHELSEGQLIVPTHWMPISKFETRKK